MGEGEWGAREGGREGKSGRVVGRVSRGGL